MEKSNNVMKWFLFSFTQNISPICLPSFKHYQSYERIMLKKVFTMVGYGTDKIWIDEYNDVLLDENFKQIDLGEHKQTGFKQLFENYWDFLFS